ncbi:unnamed protein product [Closterium sp. NIES-64]|nr:unnamed protein product [Closterium sp. NIES-64]
MGGRIVDIPLIPSGLSRDDTYCHIHHSLLLLQQVSEAVLQRVQQRVDEEAKIVADISKRVATASKQVDSLLSTRASIHIQSPASHIHLSISLFTIPPSPFAIAEPADSSVGDPRGFLAAPQLAAFFATSSIAAAGIPSTSVTGLPNFRGDLAVTGVSAAPMSRASGGDGAGEGAVGGVLLSGKEGGGVRREVLLPNPPGGMMLLSDLLPASSATSHG